MNWDENTPSGPLEWDVTKCRTLILKLPSETFHTSLSYATTIIILAHACNTKRDMDTSSIPTIEHAAARSMRRGGEV